MWVQANPTVSATAYEWRYIRKGLGPARHATRRRRHRQSSRPDGMMPAHLCATEQHRQMPLGRQIAGQPPNPSTPTAPPAPMLWPYQSASNGERQGQCRCPDTFRDNGGRLDRAALAYVSAHRQYRFAYRRSGIAARPRSAGHAPLHIWQCFAIEIALGRHDEAQASPYPTVSPQHAPHGCVFRQYLQSADGTGHPKPAQNHAHIMPKRHAPDAVVHWDSARTASPLRHHIAAAQADIASKSHPHAKNISPKNTISGAFALLTSPYVQIG